MSDHALDSATYFPVTGGGQPSLGWIPPWDPNYPKGGNPVPADAHVPWGAPQEPPVAPVAPVEAPAGSIPPAPPSVPVKDAAKAAAARSLKTGLFISLMTGIATGLTALPAGINWFTRDGLIITGGVVINSVIHSFLTYAQHLGWGPPQAEGSGDGK